MSRGLAPFWRPLKHFADFGGRSTRTEVAAFYLLLMIVGLLLDLASGEDYRTEQTVNAVFASIVLCPTVALFVRRLHDQGRSGWWLLLGLPVLVMASIDQWRRATLGMAAIGMDWPLHLTILGFVSAIVVLLLLVPDDEKGPNRFGPNPRGGDSAGEAPGTAG